MAQTIEELLKSMYTLPKEGGVSDFKRIINNSKDIWERIGKGDSFSELNFSSTSEKDEFLKDFIQNNPYLSIS